MSSKNPIDKIIKPILRTVIRKPQRNWLRDRVSTSRIGNDTYEKLYESHAREIKNDQVIGSGDFDLIGRIELDLLKMEGLQPEHKGTRLPVARFFMPAAQQPRASAKSGRK